MHRLMQQVLALAQDTMQRYEGTITQYLGDGFLALFGAPVAHEDHARRAVLAALELHQRLHTYRTELAVPESATIAACIGLHTGPVVVGYLDNDPQRLYIAISAAGAFRSDDGGKTWTPANKGVAADFMEDDKFPEVGQCVHKLLLHPANTDRLWQQNHCGVYRSDDRGASWERLEDNGLPSGFGFPIAIDPADPDVAYVVPEEGAENRVTSDGRTWPGVEHGQDVRTTRSADRSPWHQAHGVGRGGQWLPRG